MTLSEIEAKIRNAPSLDFGDIFNKCVELFKKSWLYGLLLQLFIMVITSPFIIILYVPMLMSIIAQSKSGDVDPNIFDSMFTGFSIFYIVLFILGILAVAVFQLALNAGFFRILNMIDRGDSVKVSDLFYFLKGKYFGRVTMLMLATLLVSLIAVTIAMMLLLPTFFLSLLIFVYIMIPTSFFVIIFTFNPEIGTGDVIKTSFLLGTKKWLISFGLVLTTLLLFMILYFLTCGLGSLFLSSFIFLPLYFVYKEVVGFDFSDEVDSIGKKEVF